MVNAAVGGDALAAFDLPSISSAILITPRPASARSVDGVDRALSSGSLTLREVPVSEQKQERRSLLRRILFVPPDGT